MPRRDSICGPKDRIAQKPRAEKILFAMPRRDSICGCKAELRRSREQSKSYLLCQGATVYAGRRTELRRSREQNRTENRYLPPLILSVNSRPAHSGMPCPTEEPFPVKAIELPLHHTTHKPSDYHKLKTTKRGEIMFSKGISPRPVLTKH